MVPMSDNRITLTDLHKLRRDGSKIAMLTCYDASFATLLENAGVESLLVGDSLGNVLQGHDTTLPVTMADMVYHVGCVARGAKRAFLIGDLPFGRYQENPEQAFRSAARLMAAGSHMVKLEGGTAFAQTTEFLVKRGIPVCAHLGLTPQSVHQLGGFRVQGKNADDAKQLIEDALALERSGATAQARSWYCTTCWACSPAKRQSSCAISWTARRASSRRWKTTCTRCEGNPA